jgi:hypothetical protein
VVSVMLYKDADGVSSLSSLSSFFNVQVSPGIRVLRCRDARVLAHNRMYLSDCFRYALESDVSLKFMLRVKMQRDAAARSFALFAELFIMLFIILNYYCPFMAFSCDVDFMSSCARNITKVRRFDVSPKMP